MLSHYESEFMLYNDNMCLFVDYYAYVCFL